MGGVDYAGAPPGALFGGVEQPEIEGVHAELLGKLVDHALDGYGDVGRTRRAVGVGGGLVVEDVVSIEQDVFDVVGREHGAGGSAYGRPRIASTLEEEVALGGGHAAVFGDAPS